MNPLLVVAVWALVTLDCALMGYRLAMGRRATLAKASYHRRAGARAALVGQVPLAVVTALAVALVARGGDGTAAAFDAAMGRFVLVGAGYAALMLGTWALCAIPSTAVRTAASVLVFGPWTLLRPVVVVATVVAAVGPDPSPGLLVVGAVVVVPGVVVEPVLDRRIARDLLTAL